jgi:threonine/homoserine/homoserine lactone efflux protein
MELSTWALFIPACFALNLAPGPNNLLSVHNAAAHGFASACLAGLGRLLAFALMIGLAALGLAAVLQSSARMLFWIKVAGAVYLLYLAVQLWRSDGNGNCDGAQRQRPGPEVSLRRLAWQEFLVASSNPKAILIFTAFLPQFVSSSASFSGRFLELGLAFLLLEWVAIALYAYLGARLSHWLAGAQARRRFNRACGGLLAAAACAMLWERKVSN